MKNQHRVLISMKYVGIADIRGVFPFGFHRKEKKGFCFLFDDMYSNCFVEYVFLSL